MKRHEHLQSKKAGPSAEKLTPKEALKKLDGFIAELEITWKRDGLESR